MSWQVLQGDALARLAELKPASVQTCVTSPPYWGLRDYGTATWEGGDSECDHVQGRPGAGRADGIVDSRMQRNRDGAGAMGGDCGKCGAKRIDSQLGLEPTPEEYVANLVAVFREVRRVLRDDGTVWLNLGDSYNAARNGGHPGGSAQWKPSQQKYQGRSGANAPDLKPKDLIGIPWRVAFALQADGWWLRSDIIWSKPNPMPESVTDRPTRAHEYLFLLSKQSRYFYDADAIREDDLGTDHNHRNVLDGEPSLEPSGGLAGPHTGLRTIQGRNGTGRNKRSVWTVTTQPYPDAHFATFPPKLVEPCILAGSPPKCCGECGASWERVTERSPMEVRPSERAAIQGDEINDRRTATSGTMIKAPESRTTGWRSTCLHDDDSGRALILDPFCGSGTTGLVALRHDRSFVGIELNSDYCELARNRIRDDAPLLNTQLEA